MIISRTPFRVSFFGGGTDYPAWYRQHGGAVLGTTINKYCYITCRYLPPFFEHRSQIVYSMVERVQQFDEIRHPSVREVAKLLGTGRGLEIHHDGDLPARSGMGSSSAFTVGLLNALYALRGQMPGKLQLARDGIHVEQELLHETVGSQDQVLAAYGGFNHITFHRDGTFSVRPMTLGTERIAELNSHLMLFYTGISRTAANIANTYVQAIDSKASELQSIGAMVDEAISILTSGEEIHRFGRLLDESWRIKRSLSPVVTNPEVEEIYSQALSAGAIGGKLIGAGGGGFLLLFARPKDQGKIRDRLHRLLHVPFRFDSRGSEIIFFDQEEDYAVEESARAGRAPPAFHELDQVPLRDAPDAGSGLEQRGKPG